MKMRAATIRRTLRRRGAQTVSRAVVFIGSSPKGRGGIHPSNPCEPLTAMLDCLKVRKNTLQ
jgi:hypothetical protein